MVERWETTVNRTVLKSDIRKAEQCLIDNGIPADEADTVLQALGYILLDADLYEKKKGGE